MNESRSVKELAYKLAREFRSVDRVPYTVPYDEWDSLAQDLIALIDTRCREIVAEMINLKHSTQYCSPTRRIVPGVISSCCGAEVAAVAAPTDGYLYCVACGKECSIKEEPR